MSSEEFETMKVEFRRKVNAKYKILGVKWVEKWLLEWWTLMRLRKMILTIKYYHWNQEISIQTRQIGHHNQKPTADQGRANKKLLGLDKQQINGNLEKIFRLNKKRTVRN